MLTTILAGTLATQAVNYSYLTIEQQDGTKLSIAAEGLTITFSNGSLVAGSTTISLTDLSRMYFSNTDETTSGITTVKAEDLTGSNAEVYDLSGRRMPNTSALPKGIYVIKQNGTTKKVQVK